jgi:two-component system nitrogen regulation response regulator GlnG
VASKILIVDHKEEISAVLSEHMAHEGLTPLVAHTVGAAMEKIRSEHPDALIVDLKPPEMDGVQILKEAKALDEDLPVILLTGYPEIRGAVAAMRAGAHDYLAKPLKHHEVLRVVFRALNECALKRKLRRLSSQIQDESSLRESMGPSDAVSRLTSDVCRVAKTNFSVLILGETGSGKELVAHAIHQLSSRCEAPFMAVDCGAIPETLLESELFGHEKGAYTGADTQKPGKFELANGGTIFLDEICNLPLGSQAKLLRALQEKGIYRVGSTRRIDVDVRLLAAANRGLAHLNEQSLFRQDLFFRLNEFAIRVPPLRERQEDILYLAKRFIDLTNLELHKNVKGFTQSAVDALLAYKWPGNARQLRSVVRRAVLLADDMIAEQHLGIDGASPPPAIPGLGCAQETEHTLRGDLPLREFKRRTIVALEREILAHVLRETGGNKAKAARLLHIDYKTIHSKIRQYGISLD